MWTKAELGGKDVMNLAQPTATVLWAAGHDVLAKSVDGGIRFTVTLELPERLRPSGCGPAAITLLSTT